MRRLAIVALALVVVGCGDEDEGDGGGTAKVAKASAPPKEIVAQIPGRPSLGEAQARGTYVGTAGQDRGRAVAFVVHGDQVVVYVCDGKKRSGWFGGRVVDGRINLESENGIRVIGTVTPRRVTGTVSLAGAPKLQYVAVPAQVQPRTGLYVFDDPGKKGFKARWIVTRNAVHGLSATATGSVTNGVTVKAPTGSTSDSRFSGVSPQVTNMLAQQQQLQAELKAATSENTSLRETLSGTTTTNTGTTTTKTP